MSTYTAEKRQLPDSQRSLRLFVPIAALWIIGLLFFSRSFTNYFVADDFYFLGRIDFSIARSYFFKSWGYGNEYRPIVAYSYALDALISGNSPMGYHVTNTLLHLANATWVGLLVTLLGGSLRLSWLVTWIFLLNPVTHESVLWISGRPVVLGTFFILGSCYCFARAWLVQRNTVLSLACGYGFFILALCTYESAIVTPLLVVLVCAIAGTSLSRCRTHLIVLFSLAGLYALLWNLLFHFKITRFPVTNSIAEGLTNLAHALSHTFPGSGRWPVALAYAVLIVQVLRRRSWRVLLVSFVWFITAYLPFFLVQGYADRFGYLASSATAAILGLALTDLFSKWRSVAVVLAIVLIAFFAVEMERRISGWKEAGRIARAIPEEIKRLYPIPPENRLLVLLNIPQMHKGAYVYLTGLDRALQLEYPGAQLRITGQLRPWADENSILLEYVDGKMIRRVWSEVESRYR